MINKKTAEIKCYSKVQIMSFKKNFGNILRSKKCKTATEITWAL